MIKIVYTVSTLQKTGPTNVLTGIIAHLDRKLYKPYIITLSPEQNMENSWLPALSEQNVEIVTLGLSRYQFGKLQKQFKKEIVKINPDIVHSHCFRSTLLTSSLPACYKRVATVHCDYREDFTMAYGKIKGRIMAWLFTHSLKKLDRRICCSAALSNLLQKRFSRRSFDYVNNGINTDVFHPISDKDALRSKLGIPAGKIIFIWAGSFIPRKNPLCWVQAIKKINHKNAFFLFCGEGPLLTTCQKELHNFSQVLFTGYTLNLNDYLKAADVYVSSSLSEGLPCAVLESLSCGETVLLSDIPQHRYIFTKQMGFLVDKQNSEMLCQQAEQIKTPPTAAQEQSRYQYIQKYFSYQSMSQAYQTIYHEILKTTKANGATNR